MRKALIVLQGLLMTFAAFYAVSLIYSIINALFYLITGVQEVNPQVDYCLVVLAVMVSILILNLWYRKFMSIRHKEQVDLKKVFKIKHILAYLGIGTGCQLFFSGILTLLRPVFETLFARYDETISSIFISDPVIAGVYVVILAPVIEELMLRGILFRRIRPALPFYAANLIQAVVFGIYHWNIIQGLYAFGIGLILGYIYEKTKTLWAPIFVHSLINGTGFLILQLDIGIYIPVYMSLILGSILLLCGLTGFVLSVYKEKNNNNTDDRKMFY
ncbi:MAG TPA: type II CAAX endopeptidase family protein [Mobilitalea sp.]|nr:type II CAAX endopeptidase family protein [Mobilitalea sp.]